MVAGLEDVGGLGANHHRAHGHARAQALGQRHHVGLDAGPLVGKPLAGAAHAALHFVNHQEPVALVAQGAHIAQVVHVHGVHAAFALNGLKEHGHHIGVAFGGRFELRRCCSPARG